MLVKAIYQTDDNELYFVKIREETYNFLPTKLPLGSVTSTVHLPPHDKDSSLAKTLGAIAIIGGIIVATILTAGLIEIIAAGGVTALVAGGEAAIGGTAVAGLLVGETAAASTIVEMAVIGSKAVPVGLRVGASVLGATF